MYLCRTIYQPLAYIISSEKAHLSRSYDVVYEPVAK
jgi:hypothetical protein